MARKIEMESVENCELKCEERYVRCVEHLNERCESHYNDCVEGCMRARETGAPV